MTETIGQKIRQIRRAKSITQKELADFLNCSEAQISHIENGNRKINMDDLEKLSNFLGIEYNSFFKKNIGFVNFRHDKNTPADSMSSELLDDFKKYAQKNIHDNQR